MINKNITPKNEYDIQIRSSKLATTGEKGYSKPKLKILMDYILKLDDEQINLLKPGSIFIDEYWNICEILQDTDKLKQDSHPDSQIIQEGILKPGHRILMKNR